MSMSDPRLLPTHEPQDDAGNAQAVPNQRQLSQDVGPSSSHHQSTQGDKNTTTPTRKYGLWLWKEKTAENKTQETEVKQIEKTEVKHKPSINIENQIIVKRTALSRKNN